MINKQIALRGVGLTVGLCALVVLTACERPMEPPEPVAVVSDETVIMAQAKAPLPEILIANRKAPLEEILRFIRAREARILLAWDAFGLYGRRVHEGVRPLAELFEHGEVLRLAGDPSTEEIVLALPEWVYLSETDQAYVQRALEASEQRVMRRWQEVELSLHRLGWENGDAMMVRLLRNAFGEAVRLKAYLGELSPVRQRAYLDAVKASMHEEGQEALWKAIVTRDAEATRVLVEAVSPAKQGQMLGRPRAGVFGSDFNFGDETARELVAMMLAQAFVLTEADWSFFAVGDTLLIAYCWAEHEALRESLLTLADEMEKPPE